MVGVGGAEAKVLIAPHDLCIRIGISVPRPRDQIRFLQWTALHLGTYSSRLMQSAAPRSPGCVASYGTDVERLATPSCGTRIRRDRMKTAAAAAANAVASPDASHNDQVASSRKTMLIGSG